MIDLPVNHNNERQVDVMMSNDPLMPTIAGKKMSIDVIEKIWPLIIIRND